jgi:hypothetical protein
MTLMLLSVNIAEQPYRSVVFVFSIFWRELVRSENFTETDTSGI